jgi:hypothetical protein
LAPPLPSPLPPFPRPVMLNVFLLSDQVRMKSVCKWFLLLYPKPEEDLLGSSSHVTLH